MLRAFVDESGFDGKSPAYVLGGYIAEESVWESFSEEWQQILDMKPRISYFKLDEALKLSGQFQHWREEMRDEKVLLLNGAIDDRPILGMTCSMPCADYDRVASDPYARSILRSPYYYLLFSFVLEWMELQQKMGLSSERIQFVFDQNMKERKKIFDSWKELREASYLPRRIRNLISSSPIFADDRELKPLQAADLIAGICRRRWIEKVDSLPPLFLPRRKAGSTFGDFSIVVHEWDESSLRETIFGAMFSYVALISGKIRRGNGIMVF